LYDGSVEKNTARMVLRELKRRVIQSHEQHHALFHALAVCMTRVGHRVVLHHASGAQVRALIVDAVRKAYLAVARSARLAPISYPNQTLARCLVSRSAGSPCQQRGH
jgi:hypothetical protein